MIVTLAIVIGSVSSRWRRPTDEHARLHVDTLAEHGVVVRPFAESVDDARRTRRSFAPAMEYLIDDLLCPRGFWTIDSTVRRWSGDRGSAHLPNTPA